MSKLINIICAFIFLSFIKSLLERNTVGSVLGLGLGLGFVLGLGLGLVQLVQ